MSKKDFRRTPHDVSRNVWWYETNAGIELYAHEPLGIRKYIIPWRVIRAALKRKDK